MNIYRASSSYSSTLRLVSLRFLFEKETVHFSVILFLFKIKKFYFSVIAVLLNGALISLILKNKRKELGAYRYLLVTFASVDIYYGLVHICVQPVTRSFID